MIEDGFHDEQEYLDYLSEKADRYYERNYGDDDEYYYEEETRQDVIEDNGNSLVYASFYKCKDGDENSSSAVFVKRLLHKDFVITAYELWEKTVSSSEIESILCKWKEDNHTFADDVDLSIQFECWHCWACKNIHNWLFYYDSSILILAKNRYLPGNHQYE